MLKQTLLAICVLQAFAADVVNAEGPVWSRRFEDAQKIAKSDGKHLFIVFTGHGWCHACELLDRQVFRTTAFVDPLVAKYVFLELDFNFADTPEDVQRKSELSQLRAHYLAPAVPIAVLANADGVPFGIINGYDAGSGPQIYLGLIAAAEKGKLKYEELLARATSEKGNARAALLDGALDSLAPALGSRDERGDDPILHFYGDTVQEILTLTDGDGALADKYVSMKRSRADWLKSESVFTKLKEFESTKDYAGAIIYIQTQLSMVESAAMRWRLEWSRQLFLESNDKNEEALSNCRRLLLLDGIADDDREHLLDREAFNLFRLDRVSEGLAHYDARITAAAGDDDKRLRLLFRKGQLILGRDPVSESINVWKTYRDETKRGTDRWFVATALLARELRRADRHEEALRTVNEFLDEERTAWILLDAAESYIALANHAQASKFIDEARSANERFANSPRKAEHEQYTRVVARIDTLSKQIDGSSIPTKRNRTNACAGAAAASVFVKSKSTPAAR